MSGCTETGKRVQVLLSTYNGERYLREQLDSFVSQTGFDAMRVLIRDDGSTDGTRTILSEYAQRYGFVVEYGENVGITESYLWLLRHSDSSIEYFAFSDQDDVWLPDKILLTLSAIDGENADTPILCGTLSHLVGPDLQPIGDFSLPKRPVSFYNAMIQNVIPGHTQIINRTMVEHLLRGGSEGIHVMDWWVYLVCSAIGKVILLPNYTVQHRVHAGNAVGVSNGFFKSMARRIAYIRDGKGNAIAKQLQALHRSFSTEMPESYRDETERFLNSQSSFSTRLHYAVSCKAYRQNAKEDLAFRLLYLMGKYRI